MINNMEMLARDHQAKLLAEAAESRMRRLAGGVPRHSVHPVRRLTRFARGQR
jgi:hypothetical protein